jgi:hypothetical protein
MEGQVFSNAAIILTDFIRTQSNITILTVFFIRISNPTKGKGEVLGLPSRGAVWLIQSFAAQRYILEDVGRLQNRCGNHEFRKGKVISAPNRQKRRCYTVYMGSELQTFRYNCRSHLQGLKILRLLET